MKKLTAKNVKELETKHGVSIADAEALQDAVYLNFFPIYKWENGKDSYFYISEVLMEQKVVAKAEKRTRLVTLRNELQKAYMRPLRLVKKDLNDEWSRLVKLRDGHKCFLCPTTKNLTAHHWYRNAQRSKMGRWNIANGITLCYACHIHAAHERPDWLLYQSFYDHILDVSPADAISSMDAVCNIEATDAMIRKLWYNLGLNKKKETE